MTQQCLTIFEEGGTLTPLLLGGTEAPSQDNLRANIHCAPRPPPPHTYTTQTHIYIYRVYLTILSYHLYEAV